MTQDGIVPCECNLHRLRRVLPQAGAALDVRQQDVNVPVGNGGVEASARVVDGIGVCAIQHGPIRPGLGKIPYECRARKAYHVLTRLNQDAP